MTLMPCSVSQGDLLTLRNVLTLNSVTSVCEQLEVRSVVGRQALALNGQEVADLIPGPCAFS